ncbi:hypothetical protein HK17_14315 [Acetobacter indonesiensis]|uniref:FecR protein domain-containing protein n=2 Tax=Acetobacter indonesiensis TaxID=104101 RepID=A0A252AKL4_9PROT|nr:hypothetical protein HK17_14315 [Acetobacter indonesiensis]
MASGKMTADELSDFQKWRDLSPEHNSIFENERTLWRKLAVTPLQDHALQVAAHRLQRKHKFKTRLYTLTALAASTVFLLYTPTLKLWWQADQWTGTSVRTVMLADGSEAVLDSNTAITVHYTATRRDIGLLRGNALFKVRHDPARPFQVADRYGKVEDIGTVFEVRDEQEKVSVSVLQGCVDVHGSQPPRVAARLHEGERFTYGGHGDAVFEKNISPDDIAVWARGELMLDNATVTEAVRALARYLNGAVYVWREKGKDTRISGSFRLDRIDDALKTIAATAGLKMLYLPGHILVLRPL